GELWFLFVVLRADLHEGTEAAHTHAHRLAGLGVYADVPRHRDLLARHVLLDLLHFLDEGLPEFRERQRPVLFAARHGVELVFERGGEAVLDVTMEVLREEAADDLA